MNETEKIICIYKIENKITNKLYIGQTRNYTNRVIGHKSDLKNRKDNLRLQEDWDRYGENNFEFSIIEECSLDELNHKEKYYILLYESTKEDKGYNVQPGGNRPPLFTGRKHSEETKRKIGNASLGNKHWLGRKHSPETIEKIRKSSIGVIFSQERKNKISDAKRGKPSSFKGKKHTAVSIQKMSIAQKGKKPSEETKLKISKSLMGNKRPNQKSPVYVKRKNSSSKYYGVSYRKKHKTWVAQISVKGKKVFIHEGKDEIICAKKYNDYVLKNNLNLPTNQIDEK